MNFLYLFAIRIAHADTISVPVGGGASPIPTGLQTYVAGLFQTAFMFAGVLAFGAIVYSSVRYALGAANASQKSDAKDGIVNALLGLLLLLSAGVILNVINPEISNIKLPPLKQLQIITTGAPGTTPTGLSQAAAQALLGQAGISFPQALNLAGLQQVTINELASLKAACNCEILLTSAVRPPDPSQRCPYNHSSGHKVDIAVNTALNNFIESGQNGFTRDPVDRTGPNGGPRYWRGNVEYVKEANGHWDVSVGTCL
jgi:hypothetical protein